MDKKYIVQDVSWTEGIERKRDPVPRPLYRPGDVIELDPNGGESVKEFLASGLIIPVPDEPKKTKEVANGNDSSG